MFCFPEWWIIYIVIFTVKDKYGESSAMKMIVQGDEDSSSTSESEDEDGEVSWSTSTIRAFKNSLFFY